VIGGEPGHKVGTASWAYMYPNPLTQPCLGRSDTLCSCEAYGMPTKREKEAHTILAVNKGEVELVAADEVVGGKRIRIEHGHSDLGLLKLL
jgi:hypothetical protein